MFTVGTRVQLHPSMDHWMKGDRFGRVAQVIGQTYHVKLDSGNDTLAYESFLTRANDTLAPIGD